MLYTIDKEFRWEMGHRLKDHSGQCSSIHGHSYRTIVTLKADRLGALDFVLDFYHLKPIKEFIDQEWDHHFMVEDTDPILEVLYRADSRDYRKFRVLEVEGPPTAENISKWLFERSVILLDAAIQKNNTEAYVYSVQVWETPTCSALYRTRV